MSEIDYGKVFGAGYDEERHVEVMDLKAVVSQLMEVLGEHKHNIGHWGEVVFPAPTCDCEERKTLEEHRALIYEKGKWCHVSFSPVNMMRWGHVDRCPACKRRLP